jgi:integrase
MPVALTETAISRAFREVSESGKRRDVADSRQPGLRLRLSPPSTRNPQGLKRWELHCRDRLGAMRRFGLGAYPEMGLSDARSKARLLRIQVRDHHADPVADRRRDRAIGRAARAGEGTLEAMIDLYELQAGSALKSWDHSRKRVDLVFAPLMQRPVAMLTARDIQAEADSYRARQSAAFAVRTIRPALKWLAYRGHVPVELIDIRQPVIVQRRDRVLSHSELAALLLELAAANRPHARLLRFLLLTAARLNEACGATWGNVSLEKSPPTWTISETKNGQTHVVPLSRQAVDLLWSIRPASLVPTARVFATGSGKPLGNWDRETKRLMDASGTAGWHRHDLRRTAATVMGDLGITPDIIEAALNHVAVHSRQAAVYNQSRYRPQVADALQRLADHLDTLAPNAPD